MIAVLSHTATLPTALTMVPPTTGPNRVDFTGWSDVACLGVTQETLASVLEDVGEHLLSTGDVDVGSCYLPRDSTKVNIIASTACQIPRRSPH